MTINKATRSVDLFNTIRGAAVAMMAQTPESPDLQELLRKLQTTLAEYLGSEPSEGILVEPDPIETEDDCTYGGGEMPRLTRAEVLHRAEQCVCGQREQDYGTPEDNFETIAEFWITYLNRACVDEEGCVYIDARLRVLQAVRARETALSTLQAMRRAAESAPMYDREEYEWYKTHGICVRCRKAKARRGRTTCAACAAQNTERTLRYFNELTAEKRKEYSQRATEKQRERRDARYAAGLCVICGKRPPRDNRRTCALCSSKRTGARQRKAEIEEETET